MFWKMRGPLRLAFFSSLGGDVWFDAGLCRGLRGQKLIEPSGNTDDTFRSHRRRPSCRKTILSYLPLQHENNPVAPDQPSSRRVWRPSWRLQLEHPEEQRDPMEPARQLGRSDSRHGNHSRPGALTLSKSFFQI